VTLAEELALCAIGPDGMPAQKGLHGVGGAIAAELVPAGEEPRQRLRALAIGEARPASPRDALLAGLAASCDLVKLHVPKDVRKEATKRAEALADESEIPEHVRDAIKGAQAATASATLGAQGMMRG
jgi:hypothetical protein